jgi:hypothetical protein
LCSAFPKKHRTQQFIFVADTIITSVLNCRDDRAGPFQLTSQTPFEREWRP